VAIERALVAMATDTSHLEVTACLASIERMAERARLLSSEFDRNGRRGAASLNNAISFPELCALDRLCKDALERALPEHPAYAANWHINENSGLSTPEEIHSELLKKKQILLTALHVIEARRGAEAAKSEIPKYGLPKEYRKIADSVERFLADRGLQCNDYDHNVFIMTRFERGNKQLEIIDKSIRYALTARGFAAHRADDRIYPNDRNLWDNACTYMFCCKFGIAVLENIIADEFNPNVALEYGFMRALAKPTLLLKESRFKARADILGTVWEEFNIFEITETVPAAIDRWLRDLGV
jgi:hypothetical protein